MIDQLSSELAYTTLQVGIMPSQGAAVSRRSALSLQASQLIYINMPSQVATPRPVPEVLKRYFRITSTPPSTHWRASLVGL